MRVSCFVSRFGKLVAGLAACMASGLPMAAHAAPAAAAGAQAKSLLMCIFDPIGASGAGYNLAKDYALAMQKLGADVQVRSYTDERVAVEDFRTGQCDAVGATGLRTRAFNSFTASIDSIGASTIVRDGKVDVKGSYEVVHKAIETFSSPAAAKMMVNGPYEIGGIFPLGAAFAMVNDRKINSVEAAAGKRIAAFDHDKAQAVMIQRIGAQPVSADVTNFGTKFNNGVVDVVVAPAIAYKPMELYRGVGTKGAVSRFPMMILSYQMVFYKDRFPAGFGEKSREFWVANYAEALKAVHAAEADIPAAAWLDFTAEDARRYMLLMRDARMDLTQRGLYDKRGLKVLKKIRCSVNPADAECGTQDELN